MLARVDNRDFKVSLAQAGAQVIKLEPPGTGDRLRRGTSIVNDIGERAPMNFIALNRGKLGVTLNLKHPEGKDAFKKLAAVSDVLVENYRPGVLAKLAEVLFIEVLRLYMNEQHEGRTGWLAGVGDRIVGGALNAFTWIDCTASKTSAMPLPSAGCTSGTKPSSMARCP